MRHKELFKTYVWLIDTIYRHGPVSLEELGRRWLQSSLCDGNPLSRTSFNRHREEIEDAFGIRIVCDRRNGWRYSLEDTGKMKSQSVQTWMANTLSLNNVMAENRAVHDRILLEHIPSEGANLQKAIEAMKHGRMVRIVYRKYQSNETKQHIGEPYCVKLYRRRWYLLMRNPDTKAFVVWAFDRIIELDFYKRKFKMEKDFDAAAYFGECFGTVRNDEIPLQKIVLRTFGKERFYMRDLPLHSSQTLVSESADYTDYAITIRPTDDFIAHLLSRAEWIQVRSPKSLVQKMKSTIAAMQGRY